MVSHVKWVPIYYHIIHVVSCYYYHQLRNMNSRPLFHSLWPNDTFWWHRSGSALAQVMTWCLTAPCHYLNHCWIIISEVLSHSLEKNFTWNALDLYCWYQFENCGLVMPNGDIDLGQHWFRKWLVAWWHQAITWTNVDLSSSRSKDNHLMAISQDKPQPSITEFSLKITYINFLSNLPGDNELRLQPHLSGDNGLMWSGNNHNCCMFYFMFIARHNWFETAMYACHNGPDLCQHQPNFGSIGPTLAQFWSLVAWYKDITSVSAS